jgi:hypothetical protein
MQLYWPTYEGMAIPYFGPEVVTGKVRRAGKVWVPSWCVYDIWRLCEISATHRRPVFVTEQGRLILAFIAEPNAIWLMEAHETEMLVLLFAQVMQNVAGSWLAGASEVARACQSTRVGL